MYGVFWGELAHVLFPLPVRSIMKHNCQYSVLRSEWYETAPGRLVRWRPLSPFAQQGLQKL